jgi:hypothetical protein
MARLRTPENPAISICHCSKPLVIVHLDASSAWQTFSIRVRLCIYPRDEELLLSVLFIQFTGDFAPIRFFRILLTVKFRTQITRGLRASNLIILFAPQKWLNFTIKANKKITAEVSQQSRRFWTISLYRKTHPLQIFPRRGQLTRFYLFLRDAKWRWDISNWIDLFGCIPWHSPINLSFSHSEFPIFSWQSNEWINDSLMKQMNE